MNDSIKDLASRVIRSDIDGPISRRETVLLFANILKYNNQVAIALHLSSNGRDEEAITKLNEAAELANSIQEALFAATYKTHGDL